MKTFRPVEVRLIVVFIAMTFAGCTMLSSTKEPPPYDETEINPAIYSKHDDPRDPFAYKYADFRERRARDMQSPDSPPPLERYAPRHRTEDIAWGDLRTLLPFDWDAIEDEMPDRAAAFARSIRLRVGFDHPDLQIRQLIVGAGGVLPGHADGAPGMWVVTSGRGTVTVEDEAERVTLGSTVKLEPYAVRRIEADDGSALHLIWIRWAPGGDQAYVDAGYYLTGANQHVQPPQARFRGDYLFWGDVDSAFGPTEASPIDSSGNCADSAACRARRALKAARAEIGAGTSLYPDVPVFGHDSRRSWLSKETLKSGGFFFSRDLGEMIDVADTMIDIARHKAIFRASRPDGRWDFNFSETAWGARATYVEHSHVIPEFYYMLSGPYVYGVDGVRYEVQPGDILFNNSYSPHLLEGTVDGRVSRSFSSTFAPNGDRSVFDRPAFLVEPLPAQPAIARLPEDVRFHGGAPTYSR